MRQALADPQLLGGAMLGDSWTAWRVLLIAAVGEKLTSAERKVFRKLIGRDREPLERCEELVVVKGRRSGGTTAAAVLIVYLSALVDYSGCLAAGERGLSLFLAPSARQSQVAFDRAAGIIAASQMLR